MDWRDSLEVGDVITNGGSWRIVRKVSRWSNHWSKETRVRSITLAIRHCSWTHRCYTVVTRSDLKQRGFKKVAARVQLKSSGIDAKIKAAIHQDSWEPKLLTCCDVEGLP